jgi:hypothetical protein
MERLTSTTVDKLCIGDRFYKAKDKAKQVWTLVPSKKVVTKYRTYSYSALKDGTKHSEFVNADTQVIFLRHETLTENI